MKKSSQIKIGLVIAGASLLTGGAWWIGLNQGQRMVNPTAASGGAMAAATPASTDDANPASGRRVLYWYDPMVPAQKFDRPGRSPYMDMALVPKYADDVDSMAGSVAVNPQVQQSLGIRTATVTSGPLNVPFEASGTVAYNEREATVVSTRVAGTVERLLVRAPLDSVQRGQAVAELFVPEWLAAQEEFLAVRKTQGTDVGLLVDAARQRMVIAGMPDDVIRAVEQSGQLQRRMTLTATSGGVVSELAVREGLAVAAGSVLMRVNGLSSVWVNADVPESQASGIRSGATIEGMTPALPGEVFRGRVSGLLPEVNATTRTIRTRIELPNPRGRLLPGMFISLRFGRVAQGNVLQVPTEAVIQTGRRTIVMVVGESNGRFRPVDVETGAEANGFTEIRKGLLAGQRVAVSGQFLLDSEASLTTGLARLSGDIMSQPSSPARPVHHGEGIVEAIDTGEVTLSHGPIATLKWGAMTMPFKRPATALPANLTVGSRVAFEFEAHGDNEFRLIRLQVLPANTPPKDKSP